jgi:4-amino-4-deoxy-L-arabinose transferase-like glycosyltransferase
LQPTTRNSLLLFLGCLLFHLAGTWIVPLIDRDEPRFAEASREMMERRDPVVPYFNNAYRFDKPPLTYWAQSASYAVFGATDFAARFPSCLAAALTAVVLLAWGRRIGHERVGWWAAIIFSLCLQTVEHAKAAVADMWLVLFVTLAHWAGYELLGLSQEKRLPVGAPDSEAGLKERVATKKADTPWLWWWVFYISLALAFLAKGPIGWTPLLTVAVTAIFVRRLGVARRFKFARGMALTIFLVCLWGVPALLETHGQFFRIGIGRHVLGRSVTAMGGHGASSLGAYFLLFPFYFVTVFFSFFPWSLKLPWLFQKLRIERSRTDIYLLCGAAIVFGIFTLVTTRLLHYTLPAFPLLALLLARALAGDESSRFLQKCTRIAVPAYLFLALFISPFAGKFFPARELFRQSRNDLQPEMEFGAVEFSEPSLVWYFRARVNRFMTLLDRKNVESFMAEEGPRFAILPTDAAAKIFPTPPPQWKTFSTRGFNAVKGRRSDLTLILKPE